LFDWDEANFAEAAREMLLSKEYMRVQIDYKPFWEKPPIFIWMQALAMGIFGINEFAARFPNAIIGILTLSTIFYIGKRVRNIQTGYWWVALYIASWLPHFYFKTAIIDPTFNLLIMLAVFQLYLIKTGTKRTLHAILSGVFLGVAVLTKGPTAILIALLILGVYFVYTKGKMGIKFKELIYLTLACFFTTFSWFGLDIIQNGWWFTNEFIVYQIRLFSTGDAGHGQPFFYHWVVLLIGCFPASAFLFQYGKKSNALVCSNNEKDFTRLMWIMFWVVLLLFSIVKTKIVHYSSLCYFPLTYLAAVQVQRLAAGEMALKRLTKFILIFVGIILSFAIAALPIIGKNIDALIPLVKDPFAVGNMQAQVDWSYAEAAYGIIGIVALIVTAFIISKQFRKGILLLMGVQVVLIFVTMNVFVGKVERISQNAAIEYYSSFANQDVYVHPLGFKSYAYLFYSKLEKPTNPAYYDNKEEWLLNGEVDKPVYFICRNFQEKNWKDHPNLERIGEKNGFVFYKRK